MKKVSIMEAQHNLSKVMKTVEEGGAVYITRRKKVVAKLMPVTPDSPVQFPDYKTRATQSLQDEWTGASSDSILEETRGDR